MARNRNFNGIVPGAPAAGPRFHTLRAALLACSALSVVTVAPAPVRALPQNGVITQGKGTITTSGNTLTVTQNSAKLVIDWQSFNIAAGEKVVFVQSGPLIQALNRVLGPQASTILGQLSAKGTIIITNPNGILFGNGAQVNVGAIIATTSGIADRNFMAGKLDFDIPSASATASVVNRGTITASEAGLVGLVAPGVENSGIIQARLGTVQMAAGNTFTIDLYGDKLIKLAVGDAVTKQVKAADGKNLDALASNSGTLSADGGTILITAAAARDVVRNVINMDGIAQARSVGGTGGEIVLDGGAAGKVRVAGRLDATGAGVDQTGGAIALLGDDIALVDGAKLLASGTAGGGSVAVGTWDSTSATLAKGSTIDASATENGDGGRVEVIARTTTARGTIAAEGGAQGGDGGFIETSGHSLDISGITVSAKAPKGKAGDWLLDPYDLTVGAAAASSISSALAGANVTLQTTAGGSSGPGTANASGNGDILVNSAISWGADTTLILDAYHSVQVNSAITATGTGAGLTVRYNHGGSGGNFYADAPVTLPTSAALSINGQGYTLIDSLSALTDLSGHYALADDIALTGTQTAMGTLTGTLEGLGHTIDNLTINAPTSDYQGLFSMIESTGTVRNLGLMGGSVTGEDYVGMLVGSNEGTIVNSYATGAVTGDETVGGLVGFTDGGTVTSSYATGAVSGSANIGGLVGGVLYGSTVTSSHATGAVSGSANIGGLTGKLYHSTVTSSYATGAVNGIHDHIGGLVGSSEGGTVRSSYATGAVDGTDSVGGLVGYSEGSTVRSSYATGAVDGNWYVGGLVGEITFYGAVTSSYATGAVDGSNHVGGLVGASERSTVTSSYATGAVSGGVRVGGLVGSNYSGGTVTSSYWDTQTTGQAAGYGTNSGSFSATGLTSAQARQSSSYAGWDFAGTWYMPAGGTPILRASPFVLTIRADDTSMTYGDSVPALTATYGNLWAGDTASVVSGLGLSTAGTSTSNAGSYSITASGATAVSATGQTYTIIHEAGTLAIVPRTLTVSGVAVADKTYDGTTAAAITSYGSTLGNLVNGDAVAVNGTAAFSDANAGTGKTATISGLGLTGAKAGNYILSTTTTTDTADIAKRTLTVTANDASMSAGSTLPAFTVRYSGWVDGGGVGDLSARPAVTTTAASTSTPGTYALTPSGATATNYAFIYRNGRLTILPSSIEAPEPPLPASLINTVSTHQTHPAAPDARLRFTGDAPGLSNAGLPNFALSPELLRRFPTAQALMQPAWFSPSDEESGG